VSDLDNRLGNRRRRGRRPPGIHARLVAGPFHPERLLSVVTGVADENGVLLEISALGRGHDREGVSRGCGVPAESLHPPAMELVDKLHSVASRVDRGLAPFEKHHECRVEPGGLVSDQPARALREQLLAFAGAQEEAGEPARQVATEREQIPRTKRIEQIPRAKVARL
jgi:hypothetical protein